MLTIENRQSNFGFHGSEYLLYPQMQCQSVQLLSLVWLCNPMNCSTTGLPVYHQLPESTQTHVHWVGSAIQPSHLLSSPSPPALNLSQHQGLFKWVSSLYQVAKVLEFQLQHQSFQWVFRTDFLLDGLVGSPCNPKDSQESFPTPQSKSVNYSVLQTSPDSAFSKLSKLAFKCFHYLSCFSSCFYREADLSCESLCSPNTPDFGVTDWQFNRSKKSIWFIICQLFCCCYKNRSDDFQADFTYCSWKQFFM